MLKRISKRWSDLAIVAAPGPSLNETIAARCRGHNVLVVNDAHRLLPFAEVLYACDRAWWRHYDGVREFAGEKWSSHGNAAHDDKRDVGRLYELNLVRGADGLGFSFDPALIHYGENSGFQGVNVAIHMLGGKGAILLVGFDMRIVEGKRHFFGEHPPGLRQTVNGYKIWPKHFARAAAALPPELKIINCTPGSALTCFPMMDLTDALTAAA